MASLRKPTRNSGWSWDGYGYEYNDEGKRTDPDLVRVVEKLDEKANGSCANLRVVEIPDDIKWYIDEYDGLEHIAERHRTWG